MEEFRIEMTAYFGFVPGIRTGLARIAYNFGFDDKEVYEIETVVDELCNNAIEHGSKGKDKKIIVDCKFNSKITEITIRDSGSPDFNSEEVLEHCKELMEEEAKKEVIDTIRRKRGLIIVQNYVDKMDIESSRNGTIVKVIKRSKSDKV